MSSSVCSRPAPSTGRCLGPRLRRRRLALAVAFRGVELDVPGDRAKLSAEAVFQGTHLFRRYVAGPARRIVEAVDERHAIPARRVVVVELDDYLAGRWLPGAIIDLA